MLLQLPPFDTSDPFTPAPTATSSCPLPPLPSSRTSTRRFRGVFPCVSRPSTGPMPSGVSPRFSAPRRKSTQAENGSSSVSNA